MNLFGNGSGSPPAVADDDGRPAPAAAAPGFTWVSGAAATLPSLGVQKAWPLASDRWERLTAAITLPVPAERVWHALTAPETLRDWLGVCRGALTDTSSECVLDFEDGEFFLCRPTRVEPGRHLEFLWRWLGIGQARRVCWRLNPCGDAVALTVTEEAFNPPNDWRAWHGEGWPGILDQLAAHLRTGTCWRWPWRRMGPYAVVELPGFAYEVWDRLFAATGALKYWLLASQETLAAGQTFRVVMGDASGPMDLTVRRVVRPAEEAPSFMPAVDFALGRSAWGDGVGGRIWLEPGGLRSTILQVFLYGWENLPAALQLQERKILCGYFADSFRRAELRCQTFAAPLGAVETVAPGPHEGLAVGRSV